MISLWRRQLWPCRPSQVFSCAKLVHRNSRLRLEAPKVPLSRTATRRLASSQPDATSPEPPSVSRALQDAKPEDNNLLAPVHIPSNQHGILAEDHPAAQLLSHSAIVVQRQLELMNVMIGFEQANKYVIMDPQGNHIGYMAERDLGMGNMLARQWFRTHRSFTTHVFDKNELEVLRFHRPFAWISSRIRVYDPLEPGDHSISSSTSLQADESVPGSLVASQSSARVSPLALSDMRVIGEAQQQWAPLRRKYNLFVYQTSDDAGKPEADIEQTGSYSQFAYVDEPFLSWDFSLLSADSRLIGSVNRNFAGFAREIFTDTGVYALRMDAAGLAAEPRHLISQTGEKAASAYQESSAGMTLDQRAVMLATAVSVDFDYFSRKSGAGGMGFMPLWFPGAGGTAAEGGAAAEGAGVAEAGAGGIAGSAAENGAGAAVGAGAAAAGVGAMGRGRTPDDASPTAPEEPPSPEMQPGSDFQSPEQAEDVWGEWDPWKNQGGGDNPSSGGEDGGGGGGDSDWGDWF